MANLSLTQIREEVDKQVNIVEIVGHYINLTKKGRNYYALCPFHNDKSLGSFIVSEEKQIFNCFSCNVKGDAVQFVMEYEHVDLPNAIKKVCEIANISVEGLKALNTNAKPINPKVLECYKCLNEITNFYEVSLDQSVEGAKAKQYLESRGLTEEIIRAFGIGYAQSNGENLIKYLEAKGFSLKTMDLAGIISISTNNLKDSNSGRIIFPIKNENGQVVAFSARIFGDMQSEAKYINTRETICFKKSNVLYNYSNAMNEARKFGYIYLLEGFMDVIACYRVDIRSAIGLMGTALTKEQVNLIKQLKVQVRVCLDRDDPGQTNTLRTINILEQYGVPYLIVNNKQNISGKDADEILKNNGPEDLKAYLNNLITRGEWTLNYYSRNLDLSKFNDRKKLVNSYIPELANFKDKLDLEGNLNKIATLTGFSTETIKSLLDDYKEKHKVISDYDESFTPNEEENIDKYYPKKEERKESGEEKTIKSCEKALTCYLATSKEAFDDFGEEIGLYFDETYKRIVQYIEDYVISETFKEKGYSSELIIEFIESSNREGKDKIINTLNEAIGMANTLPKYSKEEANVRLRTLKQKREELNRKIAQKQNLQNAENQEQKKQLLDNKSARKSRELERGGNENEGN